MITTGALGIPDPIRRRRPGRGGDGRTRWVAIMAAAALALPSALVVGAVPASAATTYTVTATIPVGGTPFAVAVDAATHAVYVTNSADNTVSVIDGRSNAVTATVPVGSSPHGVAVNEVTDMVYVSNLSDSSVSVIDGATNTVTATVAAGRFPERVAVDAVTDTVYVTNLLSNSVSVIDGATNTVTATVAVGRFPQGVAVDAVTDTVYVTNLLGKSVSVIDGATNTVTAKIAVGNFPEGVAVDAVTDTVYVTNTTDNSMSVIDGATNTVTATVLLGANPRAVAIDEASDIAYVSNQNANTVSVINGATNTVTATVTVGSQPYGVAADEGAHTIYVANTNDNTVSVITPPIPPRITTAASASVAVGGTISDTATLAGGTNPTGTIAFEVFGPGNATCAGSPTFTSTLPVSGNGSYSSGPFLPGAGSYNFVVSYSGDANNLPALSGCGSPHESVSVTCTTTVTGDHSGALTVGAGVTCVISAHIGGTVIVPPGSAVDIENSTVDGAIVAKGPSGVRLCASTVGGTVNVSAATGFVLAGDPGDDACAANHIGGSLLLRDNTHGVEAIGNSVVGSVISSGNSGAGPLPEDAVPEVSGNGH